MVRYIDGFYGAVYIVSIMVRYIEGLLWCSI
jgi:hypothetical protein